jgi:hypothetical protein
MLLVVPLQIVSEFGVANTSGNGLTVTITVIGVPLQPPALGVIVYVAVPATEPVAVNVSAIVVPVPVSTPLTPASTLVQVYVTPPTPFVVLNPMLVTAPLQIVWLAGNATTFGFGVTVTTTTIGVPVQPDAPGVIVYVAVPAELVVAVKVWLMLVPNPAVAPLTLL